MTLLIEFYQKRFLMMYILNNMTKQPPDCIKNMVEIRVAEVQSRTSVQTSNPQTEPKVRSSSGSGSLFWGRFGSRF
jgi:hypothetical protein